ncbi:MAG: hypothetical protein ACO1OO_03455 [Flavisolibacter sp.]
MRKAAAIFFLTVFTLSFTEAGQLVKLPLLVGHYMKHQQKGDSLAAFLIEHYATPGHNDADKKEDNQLPFKTSMAQAAPVMELATTHAAVVAPPVQLQTMNRFYHAPSLQQHLHSIFHPPRFA